MVEGGGGGGEDEGGSSVEKLEESGGYEGGCTSWSRDVRKEQTNRGGGMRRRE